MQYNTYQGVQSYANIDWFLSNLFSVLQYFTWKNNKSYLMFL